MKFERAQFISPPGMRFILINGWLIFYTSAATCVACGFIFTSLCVKYMLFPLLFILFFAEYYSTIVIIVKEENIEYTIYYNIQYAIHILMVIVVGILYNLHY